MKLWLLKLLTYNDWANREILKVLESQTKPLGKIASLFSHLMTTEKMWLARLKKEDTSSIRIWPELSSIEWESLIKSNYKAYHDFITELTDENLENTISYRNSKGVQFQTPIQDILTHVFLHAAYHRGQVSAAMRQAGIEPAITDFIYYVRTRK